MKTYSPAGYFIFPPLMLANASFFAKAEKLFFVQTNNPGCMCMSQMTLTTISEGAITPNTVAVFHIKPKKRKAIVLHSPTLMQEQMN